MTTLIQRQEACIARMLEPRTSERRARKNRGAALRQFRQQCAADAYAYADAAYAYADAYAYAYAYVAREKARETQAQIIRSILE